MVKISYLRQSFVIQPLLELLKIGLLSTPHITGRRNKIYFLSATMIFHENSVTYFSIILI